MSRRPRPESTVRAVRRTLLGVAAAMTLLATLVAPGLRSVVDDSGAGGLTVAAAAGGDDGGDAPTSEVPDDPTPRSDAGAEVASPETSVPPVDEASGELADPEPLTARAGSEPAAGDEPIEVAPAQTGSADLSVGKTAGSAIVVAGSQVTFTITYANAGPDLATGVTITDPISPSLTVVSTTPDQGTCSEAGGVLTCSLGDLPSGSSGQITLVSEVAGTSSPGALANTATISSGVPDPNGANNSGSASVTVIRSVNTAVSKADGPDLVAAGDRLTYDITFATLAGSDALDVEIVDALPLDVTLVSADYVINPSGITGSCTESVGSVTCLIGALEAGATGDLTIVVEVGSDVAPGTILTNEVEITSGDIDAAPADNTATATTLVEAASDLSVTKSAPADVGPGEQLTYTIDYANAGPSDATGLTFEDPLPAGVTFVSGSSDLGACTEAAGVVGCPLGVLPAGDSGTIEIVVQVDAGATGGTVLTNTARISHPGTDPDPSNDQSSADTTVLAASADVGVTKIDLADPVVAGTAVTYEIGFVNNGPSPATGVVVTDTLPAGVTFVSATPDQGTCLEAAGTVTCALGDVAVGAPGDGLITIVVSVPADAPASTLVNTVSISADQVDSTAVNDQATEDTTVVRSADLTLTKSDAPDPVTAGEQLTYQLEFGNAGPSDAGQVVIEDSLPAGATFVSATPDQGTCSEAAGTVTCQLGTVTAGAAGSVTIVVDVPSSTPDGTVLTNSASIVSPVDPDPDTSDNTATETTTVESSADLGLGKGDTPDPAIAGTELVYDVGWENAGPSDATGVVVVDTLPVGVTFVSATPTQGTCSEAGGTVTCQVGTVTTGGTGSVSIVVDVDPSVTDGTVLTNTADIVANEPDPNGADNTATETTTIGRSADVSDVKVDSVDPVVAGSQLTYTITYQNAGPSDASDVRVTDTLPAGVTFVSATPDRGFCTQSAGTVTCVLGEMAAGDGGTIDIVVDVGSDVPDGTVLTNTATIGTDDPDPDPSNDTATAETTVRTSADLVLGKGDTPDPVLAGSQLVYQLGWENAGPSDAADVQVVDTLPAGVTFVSATPDQGACSEAGGTVTCALGGVTAGGSGQITIVVAVGSDVADGTVLTNTATVSTPTSDPDPSNDTATEDTTVRASADLSLTKTDGPDPVVAGAQLTYEIDVVNAGPSAAAAVVVTDMLPAGVTYVSATPQAGTCGEAGGTVTCALGDIAAGAGARITIVVDVGADVAAGTVLSNTASAVSGVPDPVPDDDSDTVTTDVVRSADLSILKVDTADPVVAGTQATYTVTYQNDGPSDASGVQVVDTLPAGMTFVSTTPDQGSCTEAGGVVTCALGDLAEGAGGQITIVVDVGSDVADGTVLTNQVEISAVEPDPDPDDDTASEDTTVQASADVSIGKSDAPDPVVAGSQLTYQLGFENDGPSDATGVQVVDTLPAGVTFVSATPDQGSCSEVGGAVTCALGVVTAGAGGQITIVVDVPSSTLDGAVLTNTATISTTTSDPEPSNDTASVETTVQAAADLSITKTASPDPVVAGEQVTYTLEVTSGGPSEAMDVTVVDTMPAEVTAVSATPDAGSCTLGGTVTCQLGAMPSGATVQIVIVGAVAPTAAGTLTNTAEVTSTTPDVDPSDNQATASVEVVAVADLTVTKSVAPLQWSPGEVLTWTIVVENAGPSSVGDASVTDALPPEVTAATWTCAPDAAGGSCAPASGSGNVATVLTLDPGATATIVVTGTVASDAVGDIANTVAVASAVDTNPTNDMASATASTTPPTPPTTPTTTPPTGTSTPSTTTTTGTSLPPDGGPTTGAPPTTIGSTGGGGLGTTGADPDVLLYGGGLLITLGSLLILATWRPAPALVATSTRRRSA